MEKGRGVRIEVFEYTPHVDGSTIFAQRPGDGDAMLPLHAGIDMLAEFDGAPRAMRIACDQIGDDLLDAARTSGSYGKCMLLLPSGYWKPEKGAAKVIR